MDNINNKADADKRMGDEHYRIIRNVYLGSWGNALPLFRRILEIAGDTGLEKALGMLQRCVTEKRLAWMDDHMDCFEHSGDPLMDGLRMFYQDYLGLSIPQDGEIVEHTEKRLVMRWWNRCPTLEACLALGLNTREVCRNVYQQPVEEMLKRIDPRLRFERNYDVLRPYSHYCEEMIILVE